MRNDCLLLKDSSVFIRKWIDKQPNVKEESLTDWLLYDISDKIRRITYKSFTRNEEAKLTGADWEWWFLFEKCSYKFRVQAKKIKTSADNYSSIAYTNKYGLQIENLIKDSTDNNFIPIYAFYTNKIERVKCGRHILNEGVYICGAKGINNKFLKVGRQMVNYNKILEDSIPLSCMLCCPLTIKGEWGIGFIDFLKQYFKSEIDFSKSEKILGQYEGTPDYISQLVKTSNEEVPDWWEKEHVKYLRDINGILIFDNRKLDL
jgi:hypothetical protein